MPDSSTIVSKVWNYAHVLKNGGVGYGDYIEQITYLRQTIGKNFTPRFGRFLSYFPKILIFPNEKT
jgi:hypothetical protein